MGNSLQQLRIKKKKKKKERNTNNGKSQLV